MVEHDRPSRTLTVGELIDRLSRLDPNLPVVMSQEDEPCGDYGVRSVEVVEMQRESTYADGHYGMDVFSGPVSRGRAETGDGFDTPGAVAFLSRELPYQPVIDAEIAVVELLGAAGLNAGTHLPA